MNPGGLIAPSSPFGLPAPYWFLVIFKVLGFTLHVCLMNLWYAGPILALLLWYRGGFSRHLTNRLMKQMPIIIAYGINFGIVPLLFVQVAYHKVFYPSTILMAWPWLSVIAFLTVAYYGIYIYAAALKNGERALTSWRRAVGWIAAILFIIIGFIFANEFSLMTNLDNWRKIWLSGNFAGAVYGIALNTGDPTFWPRWLMMFGMAITTTSAFMAVDTGLFASKESSDYKKWASGFVFKPYTIGIIWYGLAAAWYIFGTWQADIKALMFSWPASILTILTPLSMGLPWLFMILGRKRGIGRGLAIAIGLAQFAVILLNAVSRQVVQNAELGRYLNITDEAVHIQWSPMILFLVVFIAGVALIIWMIRQAAKSGPAPASHESINM
jgi:hypothetical protein